MCVRFCDGFYWPITYDARRSRLDHDAKTCQASCATEARLFVMPNAGEAKDMVDQQGRPYVKLPNAFKYRKIAANSCTCKTSPWDQESQARHEVFAEKERPRRVAEAQAAVDKIIAEARAEEHARDSEQKASARLAALDIGEFPMIGGSVSTAGASPQAPAVASAPPSKEGSTEKVSAEKADARKAAVRRQPQAKTAETVKYGSGSAHTMQRASASRQANGYPGSQTLTLGRIHAIPGYGQQPYVIVQPRSYPYRTY